MLDYFKDIEIPTVHNFELTDHIISYFKKEYRTCAYIWEHAPSECRDRTLELMIYRYTVNCGYAEFNSPVNNALDLHIIDNYMEEIKKHLFK